MRGYMCTVRSKCTFIAMCPATEFDAEKLMNDCKLETTMILLSHEIAFHDLNHGAVYFA